MTDLIEQLGNYGQHFDRAIGHGEPPTRSADHTIQSEPDQGDLIAVDIQTREPTTDRPADTIRRKWLPYTILAAAAVILVILAVSLFSGSEESTQTDVVDAPTDDDVPAPAEQAPEPMPFGAESSLAVADAYFAAYDSGDIDALLALFPDDATFSANLVVPGELRLVWSLAQGTVLTSPGCTVVDEVPGLAVTVSCEFGTLQAPALAVDASPVSTTTEMTITPGGISDHRDTYSGPAFMVVGEPFQRWLEENHPEDAEAAGCCQGETVEESIARGELRARYAAEWAAYLEANDCTFRDLDC